MNQGSVASSQRHSLRYVRDILTRLVGLSSPTLGMRRYTCYVFRTQDMELCLELLDNLGQPYEQFLSDPWGRTWPLGQTKEDDSALFQRFLCVLEERLASGELSHLDLDTKEVSDLRRGRDMWDTTQQEWDTYKPCPHPVFLMLYATVQALHHHRTCWELVWQAQTLEGKQMELWFAHEGLRVRVDTEGVLNPCEVRSTWPAWTRPPSDWHSHDSMRRSSSVMHHYELRLGSILKEPGSTPVDDVEVMTIDSLKTLTNVLSYARPYPDGFPLPDIPGPSWWTPEHCALIDQEAFESSWGSSASVTPSKIRF